MLSALAKRRLTKLIQFMEKLPKEADKHFKMDWWVMHNDTAHVNGAHGLDEGVTVSKLLSCGTAACAAGWAATIPSFRRAGFVMEDRGGELSPAIEPSQFFDITHVQEVDLFGSFVSVNTPKQWAKRARKLVSRWAKRHD